MLVLSRKSGERIHIGNNITIEIRRVAGNRVTIALDAPRDVRILRGELEQADREFRGQPAEELGPEPYAVMHRRMSVMPELPANGINGVNGVSRDFVI